MAATVPSRLGQVSASRVVRNAALGAVGSTLSPSVSTWRRAVQLFGMEEQPGGVGRDGDEMGVLDVRI